MIVINTSSCDRLILRLSPPFTKIRHSKTYSSRRITCVRVMASKDSIATWIEDNLHAGAVTGQKFMGGSSWSSAYTYETKNSKKFFVKTSRGGPSGMFEGEALGLRAMRDSQKSLSEADRLMIPEVFHFGPMNGPGERGEFIIMEHLSFSGGGDPAELGRRLAHMHLADPVDAEAKAGKFGFPVDNTIGGTPQPNRWTNNWVEFFREKRLRHQLKLANDSRLTKASEKLLDNLEIFFEDIDVKPSVLHGDLWSGNIAAVKGQPVIFDPATYYGHHEAEFGMSWCAGFSGSFWTAYHKVIPKLKGWEDRHDLYTLYHYLNHYNLFGSGYASSCENIISRLNRKI